jgi:hypothetical protein
MRQMAPGFDEFGRLPRVDRFKILRGPLTWADQACRSIFIFLGTLG